MGSLIGYSEYIKNYEYETENEIYVKPNYVVFQIRITSESKSCEEAISSIKDIVASIENKFANFGNLKLSIIPANLAEHQEISKMLNISIFSRQEEESIKSEMTFFLTLHLDKEQDYWQRSINLSKVYELLRTYIHKYKNHKIVGFSLVNIHYTVDNKEQYRKQMTASILNKAIEMEQSFSTNNKKCFIKQIDCDNLIQIKVLNIDRAALYMKAIIRFEFITKGD